MHIVILPGDDIGPEITAAVQRVLEAAGATIDWVSRKAGLAALDDGDDVFPASTIDAMHQHKVALKGPCTTPVGEGF